MENIVQVAGKAMPGRIDELKATFRRTDGLLKKVPGFVKAEALVNYNTTQVQILYRFDDVERALAFVKNGDMRDALDPFQGLVDPNSTMVISLVEDVIER